MTSRPAGYIQELDGLRAIAVLVVLVNHLRASWLPGGFTGVDVFFVLSGYVVSRSLLERESRGLGRDLAAFYGRRVVRILPALVVCLLVTTAISVLLIPEAWLSRSLPTTGVWALLGAGNIALIRTNDGYFAPSSDYNPFTHTWSLGVEEQFYVLVPLLLLLWKRGQGNRNRWSPWLSGLIPALSMASLLLAVTWSASEPTRAFYGLSSRFWELGAGVLLLLADTQGRLRPLQGLRHSWALPLGLTLIGLAVVVIPPAAVPWPGALLPVAGTLLVVWACAEPPAQPSLAHQRAAAALRWRPARWLGGISYPLYLWHWPVIVLLRWTVGLEQLGLVLLAAAASLALACASTYSLERPLQRLMRQQRWRSSVVLAGGAALVTASSLASQQAFAQQRHWSLSVVNRNAHEWLAEAPLRLGDQPNQRTLVVLGNSHAPAYAPMLQQVHRQLGWNVRIHNMGACTVGQVIAASPDTAACRTERRRVMALLDQETKPGDVVLLASLRLQRFVDQWGPLDPQPAAVIYGPQGQRERRQGLAEAVALIEELQAQGLRVVVDAPKPVLKAPPFRCSDGFNRQHPICRGGSAVARRELAWLRAPALAQLTALQRRFPALVVWDPFPLLCPGRTCAASRAGKPLFFDGDHLSGYGNQVLAADFLALMQRLNASTQP